MTRGRRRGRVVQWESERRKGGPLISFCFRLLFPFRSQAGEDVCFAVKEATACNRLEGWEEKKEKEKKKRKKKDRPSAVFPFSPLLGDHFYSLPPPRAIHPPPQPTPPHPLTPLLPLPAICLTNLTSSQGGMALPPSLSRGVFSFHQSGVFIKHIPYHRSGQTRRRPTLSRVCCAIVCKFLLMVI